MVIPLTGKGRWWCMPGWGAVQWMGALTELAQEHSRGTGEGDAWPGGLEGGMWWSWMGWGCPQLLGLGVTLEAGTGHCA